LHHAELHLSAPIAGAATTASIARARLGASCARLGGLPLRTAAPGVARARLGRTALRATIAELVGASAIAHSAESAGRALRG
jgi:hypothetical protein